MEDLHDMWPHRWMTKKVKATSSKIHGLGVMATEDISKGEDVAVLGGIIVPLSEIKKYDSIMGDVGIQIDDNFFIVPTTREELEKTGVFNHSCEPNCGMASAIKFIAIKDIKKGEELVFDYAFTESFKQEFECACGSESCRKTIHPTDWKLPELQKKHSEYFSHYLQKKF